MNKTRLLSKRGFIYALLITGILTLTLLNFWGWFFIKGVEAQLLEQLSAGSERTAETYALLISEKYALEELLPAGEYGIELQTLQQLLYDFKETGRLEYLFIVSLDRKRFIDPELDQVKKERIRHFPLNDSLFQKVSLEDTTISERVSIAGEYFLTTYAPIFGLADLPAAVLVMEAPAEIFSTLQFFRNALFYMGLGGVAIIAIFAGIIVLAVRQLLETEEQLHRQSRLAHLGQMAAMVAHEIRNPLSIIKGSADVLRKKYAAETDELFDFIPDEINRLNRLVNDFLQFARRKELPLQPLNPTEILQVLVEQINDPRIRTECDANAPEIMLESDAFKQVMINIIDNARKSTPELPNPPDAVHQQGSIIVRSRLSDRRPPKFIIEVQDHGEGMSAETLEKIFDPFFSTRATGSGLGMAITKQLVEQMKGQISVASKQNEGTTVRLEFPV
jgi:two-component system NtrC family sensor kinase